MIELRKIIPMGAIKPNVDELKVAIANPDYISEVKYDGYRMVCYMDKEIRFTTRSIAIESARNGNPTPTERTLNLPHLTCLKHNHSGTIPDGEIWKPGCTSHDITSAIGGFAETSLFNQIRDGFVSYMMYDLLQYKGKDLRSEPYTERRKMLEEFHSDMLYINRSWYFEDQICFTIKDYLKISEVIPFEGREQKYLEIVESGGEGIILKHKDSLYYEGKISGGKGVPAKIKANKKKGIHFTPWIKWKKKDTFDCVITGYEPASVNYTGSDVSKYWMSSTTNFKYEGNQELISDIPITKFHFKGWIGSIKFGQYDKNGNLIEVGFTSGMSDEIREMFSENKEKYIGRVIKIEAMERIKVTKALREPRFKELRIEGDKNANECIIDD